MDWRRRLHRTLGHPGVQLAAGVAIAAVALWIVVSELQAGEPVGAHAGECAAAVLGIFLAVRAVALLAEAATLVAESAPEVLGPRRGWARILGFVHHPAFSLLTAVTLTGAGVIEAYEIFESGTYRDAGLGYVGLALLGGSMLVKSAFGLFGGALYVREQQRHASPDGWLARMARFFHRPVVEVAVGLSVVLLGVVEEIVTEVGHAFRQADANDLIILLGVAQTIRFLPHAFAGVELVADTDDPEVDDGAGSGPD